MVLIANAVASGPSVQRPSGKAPNYHLAGWSRALTNKAIRAGWLRRPAVCEACGKPEKHGKGIAAHHKDYARPFDVLWLCNGCHSGLHAKMRAAGISGERVRTAEEPRGWKSERRCGICRALGHYRGDCPKRPR